MAQLAKRKAGDSVHFPDVKHFKGGPQTQELRLQSNQGHLMLHNEGKKKIRILEHFTLLHRGAGQEKRAVQIYFWNSFLIKYFVVAKLMNCWINSAMDNTLKKHKFKIPSGLSLKPKLHVHWENVAAAEGPKMGETSEVSRQIFLSPTPRKLSLQFLIPNRCVCNYPEGVHMEPNARHTKASKEKPNIFPKAFHSLLCNLAFFIH